MRNIVDPGSFRVELGQRVRKPICGNNDALREREGVLLYKRTRTPDDRIILHPTPTPANPGLLVLVLEVHLRLRI